MDNVFGLAKGDVKKTCTNARGLNKIILIGRLIQKSKNLN